jgi:hypothetical protein
MLLVWFLTMTHILTSWIISCMICHTKVDYDSSNWLRLRQLSSIWLDGNWGQAESRLRQLVGELDAAGSEPRIIAPIDQSLVPFDRMADNEGPNVKGELYSRANQEDFSGRWFSTGTWIRRVRASKRIPHLLAQSSEQSSTGRGEQPNIDHSTRGVTSAEFVLMKTDRMNELNPLFGTFFHRFAK